MNYTYTGEQELIFCDISFEGHTLQAIPGKTYDLDEDPQDPRFTSGSAPASSSAVETPDKADAVAPFTASA